MLVAILLSFLSLLPKDTTKTRLYYNRIPFGQINQTVGKNSFFFSKSKLENRLKFRTLKRIDFNNPAIDQSIIKKGRTFYGNITWTELRHLNEFETKGDRPVLNTDPFPTLLMLDDFSSEDDYLKFVEEQLATFRRKAVYINEELNRENPYLPFKSNNITLIYYDPRSKYGKDIVLDYHRLAFLLTHLPSGENSDHKKALEDYPGQLIHFLEKYPENPYLSSILYLLSNEFSSQQKSNVFLLPVFKYCASLPRLKDPATLMDLNNFLYVYTKHLLSKNPEDLSRVLGEIQRQFKPGNGNNFRAIFLKRCHALDFMCDEN